jgi:hypothetical protein
MEEGSKMMLIAVAVLIVVIIVGAVFMIVSNANTAVTDSMDDLTAAMGQMDQSRFDKFDNSVLSGAQVVSALTEFKNMPTMIIIETIASDGRNYLARHNGSATPAWDADDSTGLTWDDAAPYILGGVLVSDYDAADKYNTDFKPTKTASSPDFVKTTAKFDCKLIKDANDATVGIYARQRGKP